MGEYNPDNRESVQAYIISSNKQLSTENKNLSIRVKDLEKDLEKEEDDHDNTSKKITYLRGLLINEHTMRKGIYDTFLEMKEDRRKMITQFNRYAFFKNLLFIVVLASTPMAWIMRWILDVNIFATYLTLSGVLCLIYFIFLPSFVFESSIENKLSKKTDSLLKEYKEHVKNTSYLEELANNC